METPRVYVSCVSYRGTRFSSLTSLLNMLDYADRHGIKSGLMPREKEALICRARNRALADFYYSDCTHLLTVDDDIVFPQHTLTRLINADKDIIGGIYMIKTTRDRRIAQRIPNHAKLLSGDYPFGPVPATYVSTGCMLVKREVVTEMINRYPKLEHEENQTGRKQWAFYQPFIHHNGEFREYLSEDWAFCQRAHDLGFEIWAHTGVQCYHWGEVMFTLEGVDSATQ